ncbi:MAG: hypothetical protein A3H96_09425 [Acidobacteria bacterium RIFCSPLOWO2_02_FULL_67_36]|nr:MAG: hypothetical protein A3H96_09425 [Acidobacteria bacterium RIFCSPLOWO2_02_FULL_67_36]OFW25007.1 MAG: hypothetical protein A3G21_16315 [Acidobacteria bacterium RIFCSPLOWO2_12_FULL_66_21]
MTTTTVFTGRISRLEVSKGFGFVTPDDRGRALFFHISGLQNWSDFERLFLGAAVEYTVVPADKGPRAEGIRLLDGDGW